MFMTPTSPRWKFPSCFYFFLNEPFPQSSSFFVYWFDSSLYYHPVMIMLNIINSSTGIILIIFFISKESNRTILTEMLLSNTPCCFSKTRGSTEVELNRRQKQKRAITELCLNKIFFTNVLNISSIQAIRVVCSCVPSPYFLPMY